MVLPEQPSEPNDTFAFVYKTGKRMTQSFSIGIDVGKEQLDVGTPERYLGPFDNTATGHKKIIRALKKLGDIRLVCIESTGCYSHGILETLHEAGFPVALVQPVRVRHFAKSLGLRAKTDKIDCMLIASFGVKNDLRRYAPPRDSARALRALVDRRDQVIDDRMRERNRLEACVDEGICARIKVHMQSLVAEEAIIDKEIQSLINSDDIFRRQSECMQDVSGVGSITVAVLLAYLPELGTVNRQHIAALAGLAPYNNASGKYEGKRYVGGGRGRIRKALYLAALSAVRFNAMFRDHYQKMLKNGKVKKLSVVACSRKLLVYLNTLMAQQEATQSA